MDPSRHRSDLDGVVLEAGRAGPDPSQKVMRVPEDTRSTRERCRDPTRPTPTPASATDSGVEQGLENAQLLGRFGQIRGSDGLIFQGCRQDCGR
jgi:hypothetical protein